MNPVTDEQQKAWKVALGARIKAERGLRGLGQADVRKHLGVSRETYSRIERGLGVSLDQLVTISHALGIPLHELVAKAEQDMELRPAPPKRTAYPQRARKAGPAKSSKEVNVSTRQSP